MAEDRQPPHVVEGATTGDVEDELGDATAKSAEDRKAAAALAKLDTRDDDDAGAAGSKADHEAVSKAMKNLGKTAAPTAAAGGGEPAKKVKVDAADVALLVSKTATVPAVQTATRRSG